MKGWFHWSNAVTWCVTWKITTVVKGGECILMWYVKGKKTQQNAKKNDNNKQKKIYIQKTKQKIKTNKRKQRSFLSLYFSLRAAVGSRIIQSQETERSARKNWRGKTKREKISPRFHRVRFLKHAPVSTIWTLRSFSSFFAPKPHGNACYTG